MVKAFAAAALLLLAMGPLPAQAEPRKVELALPRAAAANERIDLSVEGGVLARGAQIEVKTASGTLIGVISPFALHGGRAAGTYTFPLPPAAIHEGRVTVELSLTRYGHPARAPTRQEVRRVRLVFTRIAP